MDVSQLLTVETEVTVVMAILALVGVANTIFTLVEKVKSAKKPHDEHIEMVQRHEEKLNNDWEIIRKMQEENRLLIENDMLVIEHIINGNHVDELRKQHQKLQKHLIEK